MKLTALGYAKWSRDAKWWECACGAILPHGKGYDGDLVRCRSCTKVWEYGRWPLSRWNGDNSHTGPQPRLLVPFNTPREGGT